MIGARYDLSFETFPRFRLLYYLPEPQGNKKKKVLISLHVCLSRWIGINQLNEPRLAFAAADSHAQTGNKLLLRVNVYFFHSFVRKSTPIIRGQMDKFMHHKRGTQNRGKTCRVFIEIHG